MCEATGFEAPDGQSSRLLDPDAEDEAWAAAARAEYRRTGLKAIESDAAGAWSLREDERLLAIRTVALIDPRPRTGMAPRTGRLAITTERLLMDDDPALTLASFEDLDDTNLAADQILVALTGGTGFAITACHPRLLRVQLAEARASRVERQAGAPSRMAAAPGADRLLR